MHTERQTTPHPPASSPQPAPRSPLVRLIAQHAALSKGTAGRQASGLLRMLLIPKIKETKQERGKKEKERKEREEEAMQGAEK